MKREFGTKEIVGIVSGILGIIAILFGILCTCLSLSNKDDGKEHCYEVSIEYICGQVETRYMYCTKSQMEHAKNNMIDMYEFCGFGKDFVKISYKENDFISDENCLGNPFE